MIDVTQLQKVPIAGTEWQWDLNPVNKVVGFSRRDVWDSRRKYRMSVTGVVSIGPGYFNVYFGHRLSAKEETRWMISDRFGEFVQLMFVEVSKPLVEINVVGVLEVLNPFPLDEKKRKQQERQQQIAAKLLKRST